MSVNPAHKGVDLELFKTINWTDKDSIVKLFPSYFQEQYVLEKNKVTGVSKNVEIDDFRLKAPFATEFLLDYCTLKLEFGKRQVLYGENSTGKTLLMHQMANNEIKGFPKHIHVHHCKELEGDEELQHSVLDTILYSNPMRNNLVMCEEKLKEVIAAETDADKLNVLKLNLNFIQMNMNKIQGYDAKDRIEKMLRVLGFDEVGQARLVKDLSGGLRMRVALCMAFFIDSDLLLLDEPTNHLDFPSVLWLENRLRAYRGAFLMVSHDRELLNNVCTSVLLIEDKKIHYYPMGFKEFEKKKALEDKKKCEDIEKFLQKNRNADPSTMLGRQKFDKQKWQDAYYARKVALEGKFKFPTSTPLSNPDNLPVDQISLINLQNVRFSYKPETGHFIFNDPISFNVTVSTRCGVMGPNGAGKSTLLKLLTKKIFPVDGTVVQHPDFQLAYFGQHSTAELDLELTAIEFMQHSFPKDKAGILRNHLMKTGVGDNIIDKRIKTLSYSQRSCIVFAKLTYVAPHLLILDEPTNFLDLPSVDSLILACNKYPGALLLVSHNRDFLRKCATQFLSVVPGKFQLFDNMKSAESATYTFIQEMEDGMKVGNDILTKVPSGGSVHSTQVAGAAGAATLAGVTQQMASATISKPAAAAAAPAAPQFAANEKVKALWTDGKYYNAVVKKLQPDGKYLVTYTEYGNSVAVPASKIQKIVAAAAAAPAAKGGKK